MCLLASLALVCISSATLAAPPAPAIPDTPAGRTLKAWLDAFNSGDRAQLETYAKKYNPERSAGEMLQFRNMTGGFDLVAIDQSERLHIRFRVKERAGDRVAVGNLDVKDAEPAMVAAFGLRAIPPGMSAADLDIKVDAATRSSVIDAIAAKLSEFYIYPDVAKKMIAAMRAHQKKGEYDAVTDGMRFASLLTEHLQAVSHDQHLHVECVPRMLPQEDFPPEPPPPDARMRAELLRHNCDFEKLEVLRHNIGYVKFNSSAIRRCVGRSRRRPWVFWPTSMPSSSTCATTTAANRRWWRIWPRTCSPSARTSTIYSSGGATRRPSPGPSPTFPAKSSPTFPRTC